MKKMLFCFLMFFIIIFPLKGENNREEFLKGIEKEVQMINACLNDAIEDLEFDIKDCEKLEKILEEVNFCELLTERGQENFCKELLSAEKIISYFNVSFLRKGTKEEIKFYIQEITGKFIKVIPAKLNILLLFISTIFLAFFAYMLYFSFTKDWDVMFFLFLFLFFSNLIVLLIGLL